MFKTVATLCWAYAYTRHSACLKGVPELERKALQHWFRDYLEWMLTSNHGKDEGNCANNHAVAYDFQATSFALFIGADDVASRVITEVPSRRIVPQIEPDGRQPLELARTRSLSYSSMNLSLFLGLIDAGRMVGIDLASFESPDGRSIRRALDWLTPFYLGQAVWQHQQIVPFPAENSYAILRYAACLMNTPSYAERAESIPTLSPQAKQTSRARLMYP